MKNESADHIRFLPYLTVFIFAGLAVLLAVFLPPKHNPDGSSYYGVALFLSQGKFFDSVQGLFSPLISWLMVPEILAGISIPSAFRFVNVLVYINLLIGTFAVCRRLGLPSLHVFLVIFLTGIQTLYASSALITSDLIAAGTCIWCWYCLLGKNCFRSLVSMILVGFLGAASYYAKALQLPIFLATLISLVIFLALIKQETPKSLIKGAGAAFSSCLLFCLPWIIVLSFKYNEPIFSSQQLKRKYNPPIHTFSPRIPPRVYFKRHLGDQAERNSKQVKRYGFFENFRTFLKWGQTKLALRNLTSNASMFVGSSVWNLFLLVVACYAIYILIHPRKNLSLSKCLVISCTHVLVYMIIWGAYYRYYFPVVPIFNILFVSGLFFLREQFISLVSRFALLRRCSAHLLNIFIGIVIISICRVNLLTIKKDWVNTDREILDYAINLPIIRDKKGVITGDFLEPYPALIAYSLKREFWDAIVPSSNEKSEVLKKRLLEWEVSQVVWFAEIYPNLDQIDILERHGPYQVKGRKFYVYNVFK